MGKISDYTNVLKSKLTDLFVVYQRNNGELETKNATLEQLGDAICGEQVHADLETDDKTIIGGINENKDKVGTLSTLTTTDKSSIVGAVNEVDTDKQNALYSEVVTVTISYGGARYKTESVDVSKTGYTPIGVIGYKANAIDNNFFRCEIIGNDLYVGIQTRDGSTSTGSVVCPITVLYAKA